MDKKALILFCSLFICVYKGFAQDPLLKEMEEVEKEFEMLKDSVNNEFEKFKKIIWEEFELIKTEVGLIKPKVLPTAKPQAKPIKPIPFVVPNEPDGDIVVKKPTVVTIPEVELPEDDFSERISSKFREELLKLSTEMDNNQKVDFYGTHFGFYYNDLDFYLSSTINGKTIGEAVEKLYKNEDLEKYIFQWVNYAGIMRLNDYGLLQVVRKTALQTYRNTNKAILLTWAVLSKIGYRCRLGYSNNRLYLLASSNIKLLNTFLAKRNNKTFWVLLFDNEEYNSLMNSGGMYTYEKNLFKDKYNLDFLFKNPPKIDAVQKVKDRYLSRHKTKKVTLGYNKSYIELLKELPILDYHAYFHIPLHPQTEKRLKEQFNPILQGKNDVEKVRILLEFVQNGFDYKFDKDNFGRGERPQAAEEMLYYHYSDCEDHSALFAYLVTMFTRCSVVGVLYDSHAATAVKFPNTKPNGHYLPAPYQDYLICDATYINADIGRSMPQFINVMPQAVFKVKRLNK